MSGLLGITIVDNRTADKRKAAIDVSLVQRALDRRHQAFRGAATRSLLRRIPRPPTEGSYLALCPICAANFRHANGSSPAEIREALRQANGVEIPVTLAREGHTVRFVEVHLQDLRAVLRTTGEAQR